MAELNNDKYVIVDTVSKRLRKALSIRNMSQADLSRSSGVPRTSISQYLSGYAEPRHARINSMAKALNVSEAWLLGFNCEMKRVEFDVELESENNSNCNSVLVAYATKLGKNNENIETKHEVANGEFEQLEINSIFADMLSLGLNIEEAKELRKYADFILMKRANK